MSRLLANCSTTTTSSSSGSVTTICDCECEGCCCQYFSYTIIGTSLWFDYPWNHYLFPDHPFFACAGAPDVPEDDPDPIHFIVTKLVKVYFDECPTEESYPDIIFNTNWVPGNPTYTLPPLEIPNAGDYDCITIELWFRDEDDGPAMRCTVKLNPP